MAFTSAAASARASSASAARAEIALASANRFLSRAILNACSDMAFGAL